MACSNCSRVGTEPCSWVFSCGIVVVPTRFLKRSRTSSNDRALSTRTRLASNGWMEKGFSPIWLNLLLPASTGGALDNSEYLSAWCLDIEEWRLRVNHPFESCLLHLPLQRSRIFRPQLQPGPALSLLIRERIFCKLYTQARAVRKGDGIHRLRRMEIGFGHLMDFQTEHAGKESQQWLLRVRSGRQVNGITQPNHGCFLSSLVYHIVHNSFKKRRLPGGHALIVHQRERPRAQGCNQSGIIAPFGQQHHALKVREQGLRRNSRIQGSGYNLLLFCLTEHALKVAEPCLEKLLHPRANHFILRAHL